MAIQGELVGQYLTGTDIVIKSCNIVIHQPSVKEILQTGEDDFLLIVQLLTKTQDFFNDVREGNPELALLSDFQLLLVIYSNDIKMKIKINTFFDLVFPLYEVEITENSIDFLEKESAHIKGRINPFNFSDFQEVLEHLFIPYSQKKEEYNPVNETAAKIAQKIKEGQAKRAQQQKKTTQSLYGSFASILSIGLRIDLKNILDYTPFQLFDSFMRFERKQAEEQYIRLSTIPFADSSKLDQPDSWVENLYD